MYDINNQPLAIVGIGCRLPGNVSTPQVFWEMLCTGKDGIIEVPNNRWSIQRFYDPNPDKPGKTYVKHGGYLQQPLDEMDALFFGISPREAETLDPQQRLLLEVAWEALEDAGLVASHLTGSNTGVFIGGFMMDHLASQTGLFNRRLINTHSAVSFSQTLLSARLAYSLDLRGPCLTIDTACSSSLVAMHQASQALWRGECTLALVGGVNVMYRVETPMTMAKGQFLAADGHSKSFDARGDGYGRGEGAGIVVLKPLAQAQHDGDLIYAAIVATGINQDGHTDGITVPNPKAQSTLITSVLEQAHVSPAQIAYVEAHGTGTAIGDPIECQALGEALPHSQEQSTWIGSVKANIGHLEAAAGIAGTIKTALCLAHQHIPPVANLQTPNPNIPFAELGLRLPRRVEALPQSDDGVYAAINSFGYGGTNAHAILKQVLPMPVQLQPSTAPPLYFLPLSARSEKALSVLAGRYAEFIANSDKELTAICYSAATRREHHRFRLALVAASGDELQQQLYQFAEGEGQHLLSAKAAPEPIKPVVVMTGMGPQWWAMGQELLQQEPVFKATVERCDEIFKTLSGWSILEEMIKPEPESRITETQITQPANFVLQVGLFELWRSKGIEPAAIVGHSVGEVSAAYVAGVLNLTEALTVSYHRSRLQKQLAGRGKMLAVGLSANEAQDLLTQYSADKVSLAAINSPSAVTLSGESDILEQIAVQLEAQGVFNRWLRVELAYHSPMMAELREELLDSLKAIRPHLPSIPLYSTVTGQRVDSVLYDGEYWYQNIRQPVLFADAIKALIQDGHHRFLEVGPHPVLGPAIKEVLNQTKSRGQVVATLKRQQPEQLTFHQAFGELYCLGVTPNWQSFYPEGGQFVRLPLYPWQRERYWLESEESRFDRCGDDNDHPLVGHRQNTPIPTWEQPLNAQYLPWLPAHQVQGLVVLPGAAYVEVALQLQSFIQQATSGVLENISFQRALVIKELDEPLLRTEYEAEQRYFRIYSRSHNSQHWTLHAQGRLSTLTPTVESTPTLDSLRSACPESLATEILYARLSKRHLHYGEVFRTIQQAWRGNDQILIQIKAQMPVDGYALHPTLLDAAFQSLVGIVKAEDDRSFVPVAIKRLTFYQSPGQNLWAHSQIKQRDSQSILADICLLDDNGHLLVAISDLRCQALANIGQLQRNSEEWFYQVVWQPTALAHEKATLTGGWLLFMDKQGVANALIEKLQSVPVQRIVKVYAGEAFKQLDGDSLSIRIQHQADMMRLMTVANVSDMQGVLFAWALDLDPTQDADGTLMTTTLLYCARAGMSAFNNQNALRLFVLSTGAQSLATKATINVAQASVIGLARVITNEYSLRCSSFDIEDCNHPQTIDLIAEELLTNDTEPEVAFYQGQRWVYRLKRWQSRPEPETHELTGNEALVLQSSQHQAYWQLSEREALAPSEVELHIDYAILPPGFKLGLETLMPVCGRISRSEHPQYQSNQAIIALVPLTTLSSYIKVATAAMWVLKAPRTSLFKRATGAFANKPIPQLPDNVAYAASLMDFARALYALEHIAQLQTETAVLVHASEDNSDLAATQIALTKTKNVVATYRDPNKQQALQKLGVKQCFSTTEADFLQQIAKTNPQGFDVIMNHLNGEVAEQTLELAKPLARVFMKATGNNHLLDRFKNRQLIQLDMAELAKQQPQTYQQLLQQVLNAFRKGKLKPLPIRLLTAEQVEQALSLSQTQSVALAIGASRYLTVQSPNNATLSFKAGSYLITGGFGGFGLKLAEWLAQQGVKHLILVGRRGAVSEAAKQTLALLHDAGVQVMVAQYDISEANQVAELITKIQADFPPLVGVFHTAAVLDDAMLNDLTAERLAAVMRPKALGAWYLHHYTKSLDLDYFVLFSSISALVGKPGQGNYVAANAYLDQLAHYRRTQGLAALSINWGVLAQVGMAAQQGVEERLMRMGIGSFTPAEAMQMLAMALNAPTAQLGLMNIDWQALFNTNSSRSIALRYEHLLDPEWLTNQSPLQKLYEELKSYDAQQRLTYMIELLSTWIARIMRLPADNLDTDVPLNNFGLDSLMAVEIQGLIETQTGASLSILEIIQDNSIEQLADKLLTRLETPW